MKLLKKLVIILCGLTLSFYLGYKAHKKDFFSRLFYKVHTIGLFRPNPLSCQNYTISSYAKVNWKHKKNGHVFKTKDGQFIHERKTYFFKRPLTSCDTAIVVMDPWVGADKKIKGYKKEIVKVDPLEDRLIPLVIQAQSFGMKIIVLTNRSMKDTAVTDVHPYLRRLIDTKKAYVFYHEETTTEGFSNALKSSGIKNLFYVGFSAEKCVLFRKMGLAHMHHKPFKLFYIPEASSAGKPITDLGEKPIDLLKAVTQIVSEQCCEIVSYKDFMNMKITPQQRKDKP